MDDKSKEKIELDCIIASGYCSYCHEHNCEHSNRVSYIGLELLNECIEWRDNDLLDDDLINQILSIIGLDKGKLK